MIAASLGTMPITSVRRLISPLRRSKGLVEWSLARCSLGKLIGEHVRLGRVQQRGELGQLGPHLIGDLAPLRFGGVGMILREGGGDEGRDHAPAAPADMSQGIAHEVNPAALPGGAEHPGTVALVPSCAFETTSLTPARPRRLSRRRNSIQKVSASEGPIAMPSSYTTIRDVTDGGAGAQHGEPC